jgi:hypothetical protein
MTQMNTLHKQKAAIKLTIMSSAKQKEELSIIGEDLTDRARAFCHHYIELGEKRGSGAGAAKLAGCKPKSARGQAHAWLKQPRVIEYIHALRDRAALVSGIDHEYVMHELALNLQAAKLGSDYAAVNAAVRLLGLELGMFTERKRVGELPLAAPPVERMSMSDYMKAVEQAGHGAGRRDPLAPGTAAVVDIKGGR